MFKELIEKKYNNTKFYKPDNTSTKYIKQNLAEVEGSTEKYNHIWICKNK